MQVVAFPGTPYRRLKADFDEFQEKGLPNGARLRFVQSRNDYRADIGERELNEIEANVQDGFVHIAILPTRNLALLLEKFQLDCRLIKLGINPNFHDLTAVDAQLSILEAFEYEERWCKALKPSDWHSPLCLPPPSFEVDEDIQDFWRTCDCYRDTPRIAAAHDILQKVISRHKYTKPGAGAYWMDLRSRRFKVDKSMHGMTPAQRAGKKSFRFAWEVPVGLHYDVVHGSDGKKFAIQSNNQLHQGCLRVNVNPWGHVVVKA